MSKPYTPIKLISVAEDIRKVHSTSVDVVVNDPTIDTKALIMKIVRANEDELETLEMTLSMKEVAKVAVYLPVNYYKVNITNLFHLFCYRSSARMCALFFDQWQDAFDNEWFNQHQFLYLVRNDAYMQKHLSDLHYDVEAFDQMLREEVIPYEIGLLSQQYRKGERGVSLEERLKYLGIRKGSALFDEIVKYYLSYCDKDAYIDAGENNIQLALKKFDPEYLKKFLVHFLEQFNLRELLDFSELAVYFSKLTGDAGTEKFKRFFEGIVPEVKEKYVNWVNRGKIEHYLEGDERAKFWSQFSFISANLEYPSSRCLLMETENYYITEFLGDAQGPIYIFVKEDFRKYIRPLFINASNADVRSELYHRWTGNSAYIFNRFEHKNWWEWKVKEYLLTHQMTTVIREL